MPQKPFKKRRENPAVAAEIRRQLNAIDWAEFNEAVARRAAPLIQAYADARFRTMQRRHDPGRFKAAA